jgi:hypothetical protein
VADTVTVDQSALDDAFNAALQQDAQAYESAPPPPRTPWLNEDGSPKYGLKADGTPKKGPGGPGRGKTKTAADQARGDDKPSTPGQDAPKSQPVDKDYSKDVEGTVFVAWMSLAVIPWTKPQAAIVKNATPMLVPAWSNAAQQNAMVRGWVEKFSGEGNYTCLIPLMATTGAVVAALWESVRDPSVRKLLRQQTEEDWAAFSAEMMAAQQAGPEANGQGPTSS